MITTAEVREIAAGWARRESERRGYECTPVIAEFDLGYVVWTRQPPGVRPEPGDGGRTVIDRVTGALTTWPSVPVDRVTVLYRAAHPAVATRHRTVDPTVELRRAVHRLPSPTAAAHLTVDGQVFIAHGAKGDQEIRHHPLVAAHLREADPRALVRGVERHAELIVLSDVLHEADRGRSDPLTLDQARDLVRTSGFEVFAVREKGDPKAGQAAPLCESCVTALVHFAVIPWEHSALAEEWSPMYDERVAEPGRFPDAVAGMLADGGWQPRIADAAETLADLTINQVVRVAGRRHRHQPFPAVRRVLSEFQSVSVRRRGPGVRRQIRLLTVDPREGAHLADVLAQAGQAIGARLFPVGFEGWGDSVLVLDERGRVFALDQGGEWFLGETFDEAVVGLLTGDGPAERVRDDGTWS